MKTIHLQVEDSSYQAIINFIKLLPENRCRILEDEMLSKAEQQQLQHSLNQINQKDYSEFEDWDAVKDQL
ncbi:MAG: hypothetical protein K9L22_11470 [Methylococcaceae bacterium]|nr:hypothetical protein [Methylococcaceae bacterium]